MFRTYKEVHAFAKLTRAHPCANDLPALSLSNAELAEIEEVRGIADQAGYSPPPSIRGWKAARDHI